MPMHLMKCMITTGTTHTLCDLTMQVFDADNITINRKVREPTACT